MPARGEKPRPANGVGGMNVSYAGWRPIYEVIWTPADSLVTVR